ncbi:GmrSD restriction endonuclease domain-containing protein [Pannonibacter phragmitetus]|uniref:GmrSD restriction endonuclease domain-containing protein n=1 Tax=Pannonibacter phragmitetus TaxID=121719 RepID=UPI000ACAE639|nr:DUF262 domain-containing protein [Pannonibacter phragmitetus]
MVQTTSFSLADLLRKVKAKNLTIPQFQRPFVWRESQVRLLVDSIARSYPIGSLLLLSKKPSFPLQSRSVEATLREGYPSGDFVDTSSDPHAENFYILDGQQRTTSIARVFMNAHPNKSYYFDLKKMYEIFREEEASWIAVRARGKSDPDRKETGRLIRSDIVLDQEKTDIYVSEYFEDHSDISELQVDRSLARKASAFVKGVFELIRNYSVPVVILDRETDIESICRVFETINSTGTRLTTFDLAVARFFPTPDLRAMWDQAKVDHEILRYFDVDGERALQTIILIKSIRENKYIEPTRTDILSLTADYISLEWFNAVDALVKAYSWIKAQGVRPDTIPAHGIVVAIAGYIVSTSNLRVAEADRDFLKKWFFCRILQAGATQAANYRIAQDFRYLVDRSRGDRGNVFEDVFMDVSTIKRLRRSDNRYKAVQIILSHLTRCDLISGDLIQEGDQIHDHHIFPRAASRKFGLSLESLDALPNRIPLKERSNLQLGEGYPKEYMMKLLQNASSVGSVPGLRARLVECGLPSLVERSDWIEEFSLEKFDRFCEVRAEWILSRISEVIGDSLKKSPLSEDELVEED